MVQIESLSENRSIFFEKLLRHMCRSAENSCTGNPGNKTDKEYKYDIRKQYLRSKVHLFIYSKLSETYPNSLCGFEMTKLINSFSNIHFQTFRTL